MTYYIILAGLRGEKEQQGHRDPQAWHLYPKKRTKWSKVKPGLECRGADTEQHGDCQAQRCGDILGTLSLHCSVTQGKPSQVSSFNSLQDSLVLGGGGEWS